MGALRTWLACSLLVTVSLVAVGCASPPEAEKKAAEAAVSAAKEAEAEQYAPADFEAVAGALKTAESQMSSKAYKEAKASYDNVKDLAQKAAQAAVAAKEQMTAEVEEQLTELDKQWQDLQAKAQAAARAMKKEAKEAWEGEAKRVADALQAAKDAAGNAPALARETLAEIGASLEKMAQDLAAAAQPARKPEPKKS